MSAAGRKRKSSALAVAAAAVTESTASAAAGPPAAKVRRAPAGLSPHAGPSAFSPGEYAPAASLHAFTQSLAPRPPAVTLKLVSWNVNGFRAAFAPGEKRAAALAWIAREDADVIALQEVKVDAATVKKDRLDALLPGYTGHFCCAEKKGYAGTAFFVRESPTVRVVSFEAGSLPGGHVALDSEGRVGILQLDVRGTRIALVNVYTPNSGQKLERLAFRSESWDPAFRARVQALAAEAEAAAAPGGGGGALIVGDLNVAFHDMDVHNPTKSRNKVAGFCDAERDGFAALLAGGFVDVWRRDNPEQQQFTYWGARSKARPKNAGWRLDVALASPALAPAVTSAVRAGFPFDDHVPIVVNVMLPL